MHTPGGTSASTLGTVTYINLPLPKSKEAPPKFRGKHCDLERFIDHYKLVCAQKNVTDDSQKCQGILRYCSNDIIYTVENLESYIKGDFDALVEDFKWLYDLDRKKAAYCMGYINEFTKTWRDREITNLEIFKEYYQKYLKVAGPLRVAGHIEEKDFN